MSLVPLQRSQLLVSAGGDVLAKYGRWTRTLGSISRGGEGLKETFTRSSVGLRLASDAYYLQSAANVPRAEYSTDPLTGLIRPYLLIEGNGNTNQLEYANALATSPWSWTNIVATNGLSLDPLRGSNYTKLLPNGSGSIAHYGDYAVSPITAGENLAAEVILNGSGGCTGASFSVADTAAQANVFYVAVDLSSATVVGSAAGGSATLSGSTVDNLGNGSVRLRLWGSLGGSITSCVVMVIAYANGAGAAAGSAWLANGSSYLDAWGAQFERNGANPYPPTSPIITAGATGARAAEAFSIPLNISPRPLAVYLKAVELGALFGADYQNYWLIGQVNPSAPAEFLDLRTLSHKYNVDHGKPQLTEITSNGSIAPTLGQQVEVLALLFADGSVQIIESLAGAAEIAGPRSAAHPNGLGPVWGNAPTLVVGDPIQAMGLIALKVIDNTNGAIGTLADARAVPV